MTEDNTKEEIQEEQDSTAEVPVVKSQFPYHAAMFSVFAPIVVILLNVCSNVAKPPSPTPFIIAIIGLIVFIVAFVMGIVALCFIKKYGKEGILIRSILGILMNGGIMILAVVLIPSVKKTIEIEKKMKRYQFIAPSGFARYEDLAKVTPNVLDAYIKGDIIDTKPDIILIIEDIKGTIDKDEDISSVAMKNPNIKVLKYMWNNHAINVFRIEEKVNNVATLTYNAQIPVIPAVQIKLMGLEARDQELKNDLDKAITGISGKSNWD